MSPEKVNNIFHREVGVWKNMYYIILNYYTVLYNIAISKTETAW